MRLSSIGDRHGRSSVGRGSVPRHDGRLGRFTLRADQAAWRTAVRAARRLAERLKTAAVPIRRMPIAQERRGAAHGLERPDETHRQSRAGQAEDQQGHGREADRVAQRRHALAT
jgi:hypothetical protein